MLTQLLSSVKNTILKNFENQMYSMDKSIRKDDIIEESNQIFINAQDQ